MRGALLFWGALPTSDKSAIFRFVPPSETPGLESSSEKPDSRLAAAEASRTSRRGGGPLAFVLVFLILALLVGFIVFRMERMAENGAVGVASRVRDAIVAITGMQPRVTVNEQVVFEQARPVL